MNTPTPRTEEHLAALRIENEDSCCAIYVKLNGKDYDGDLVTADFARTLERELAHVCKELAQCEEARDENAKLHDEQKARAEAHPDAQRIDWLINHASHFEFEFRPHGWDRDAKNFACGVSIRAVIDAARKASQPTN